MDYRSQRHLSCWHYPEAFEGANECRSLRCCGQDLLTASSSLQDPQLPAAPLHESVRFTLFASSTTDRQLHRSGTCGHRQRQISKARQTLIGSAFVLRPRYLAVLSILAWPKSARTVCKSPVPFKMWRAFVRRKDSRL